MTSYPPELELQPVADSTESVDSLPLVGYTEEQLLVYLRRQLGEPNWTVELTKAQMADIVNDAKLKYSIWRPKLHWGALTISSARTKYLEGMDVGQGVAEVDFVEERVGPIGFNIDSPFVLAATVVNGLGISGLGDYDMYQRWRDTWKRVTSVRPRWEWDESRRVLWIHNPMDGFKASVVLYKNWTKTSELPTFGADWVKAYSLARCKSLLGETWLKFSGAIPTPGQGSIQLDAQKAARADQQVADLEQKLKDAQELVGISFD